MVITRNINVMIKTCDRSRFVSHADEIMPKHNGRGFTDSHKNGITISFRATCNGVSEYSLLSVV